MRVTVVSPDYPPVPGGVSDYTRRFAAMLAGEGHEVTLVSRPGAFEDPGVKLAPGLRRWGLSGIAALVEAVAATRPEVVVVQYVPHMYQRQGLSLAIGLAVAGMRRRGFAVVTLAHELYYARYEGYRVQAYGLVQRATLLPLFWGSAKVVLTVPDRLQRMKQVFPYWAERFTLLPIGNNLEPAEPAAAAAYRASLALPDGALLLLFMGLAHPSKELGALTLTLDRLRDAGIEARLLVSGGAAVDHPWAINAGFLPAEAASKALAAADMVLLPLADGASTRRTSLMNALAAGKPVVSTRGANTDVALLPPEAVRQVRAGDWGAFADAVVALARQEAEREALGASGRRLFQALFTWEALGRQWEELLLDAMIRRKREAAGQPS